jgi:hypothetical protein
VRADDVLDVDPAVQELVDLEVLVVVGGANVVAVVGLGEEARRAQDQARQAVVAVNELAQVLGGRLRHAVDVPRERDDVLRDPCRRLAVGRRERSPERARRAREDEAADAGGDGLLEEVQGPGHVRVDELLAAVRADVGLVQCRGVEDRVDALDAAPHACAVGDRAEHRGVRGVEHVEPLDLVRAVGAEDANERLAEMPGAAGDQDPHDRRR